MTTALERLLAAAADVPSDETGDLVRKSVAKAVFPGGKLSKSSVHYRKAEGFGRSCKTCCMIQGSSVGAAGFQCGAVAGDVQLEDVCDRWTRSNVGTVSMLQAPIRPPAQIVSAAAGETSFAAEKVSKAQAGYRHTEAWNRRCGDCCFVSPGEDGLVYCRRVEGTIDIGNGQSDPGDVCNLWGAANGVLPLAAPGPVESAALGPGDKRDDCQWCRDGMAETDSPEGLEDAEATGGAVAKLTAITLTPRTPEASTVPQPTVPPGGPGLFHVKGLELPPYVQHLYKHLVARYGKHDAYRVAVGVVKKWAQGVNPGGWKTKSGKGKKTHPDVQAAAAKNVAEWESDKAKAHAQSASRRAKASGGAVDHLLELAVVGGVYGPPAGSLLPPRQTAPGAKPLIAGQLRQQPMQTVAASPPLPPGVKLPTSKDIMALVKNIQKQPRTILLTGAIMQGEAAAHKMATGDSMGALHGLRSVQTGIHAHAHKVVGDALPVANVFSAANPPAEASTIQNSWVEAQHKRADLRALHLQCSQLIDRIRRYHFHGHYGSISQQTRWL